MIEEGKKLIYDRLDFFQMKKELLICKFKKLERTNQDRKVAKENLVKIANAIGINRC
jgi:hypothetical protein